MEKARKLRVLVAQPDEDNHTSGARVVALAFRDAGFEVICGGCRQTPDQIVSAAIQEDVDMIGLSILSNAHSYSFPRLMELLRENKAENVSVVAEGPFPLEDFSRLKEIGIKEIFPSETKPEDIADWVNNNIKPRRESSYASEY